MTKENIYKLLQEEHIKYELTEHEALFSMDVLYDGELPHPESLAITVKGDKRVDLNAFSLRQGLKRLSFSTAEMLDEIMHLKPGSVTPFGLLSEDAERVDFYIDEDFIGGIIGIHPCDNTATVWMNTDDLLQLLAARGHHAHITKIDRKED